MKVHGKAAARTAAAVVLGAALASSAGFEALEAQRKTAAEESDRTLIQQRLPELDGKNLTASVIEVNYPAGTGSEPHSHPCAVIGYVVSGTIESQVKGQAMERYTAGQTFYEPPNGVHAVSRNPSGTKPARLLAYFLCDHAGPLSVPVPPLGGSKQGNK
jgi:quercetin dioxygenase-like cupin family protein